MTPLGTYRQRAMGKRPEYELREHQRQIPRTVSNYCVIRQERKIRTRILCMMAAFSPVFAYQFSFYEQLVFEGIETTNPLQE